jgi:uncharacterized protein YkwD
MVALAIVMGYGAGWGNVQAQQLDIGINPVNFHVYVSNRTNEYRLFQAQARIPATPPRLRQAAQKYAEYLAQTNTTGHNADGRNAGERLRAEGFQPCYWSENVYQQSNSLQMASWQNAADGAMIFWRNSPDHAANMRDPKAKRLGVGVAAWKHGDLHYYKVVQVFGDDCAPPTTGPRGPLGRRISQ